MRPAPRASLFLAWTHASRSGSKTLLVAASAALVAAGITIALALGEAVEGNTRRFLVGRYSGELVVAEGGSAALFGYASITGNERQALIRRFPEVEAAVKATGLAASIEPLLVGYVTLSPAEGREVRCIAFGIDAADPRRGPIGFGLRKGSEPPGPGAVLVAGSLAPELGPRKGEEARGGQVLTACALREAGLGLRPLRISGFYDYDGGVSELDRIVYLDSGTARRLLLDEEEIEEAEGRILSPNASGKAGAGRTGGPEARPLSKDELSEDRLFASAASVAALADRGPAGLPELDPEPGPEAADTRTWHYLRIRLASGADAEAARRSIDAALAAAGLSARAVPWEAASSGYARSGELLRAIALGALAIVALFADLALAGALGLLVAGRGRCIATARALGAPRGCIFAWTVSEGLMGATSGAALGALAAAGVLNLVSRIAPPIASPAFREIFASNRFAAPADPGLAAIAFAAASASALPPILAAAAKAMRPSPARAMRA